MSRVFVGRFDDVVRRGLDWSQVVSSMIKVELKRRRMSYADLSAALAEFGVEETEASIRNKLSRGTFPASFLVQCLAAMKMAYVDLTEVYEDRPPGRRIVVGEPEHGLDE